MAQSGLRSCLQDAAAYAAEQFKREMKEAAHDVIGDLNTPAQKKRSFYGHYTPLRYERTGNLAQSYRDYVDVPHHAGQINRTAVVKFSSEYMPYDRHKRSSFAYNGKTLSSLGTPYDKGAVMYYDFIGGWHGLPYKRRPFPTPAYGWWDKKMDPSPYNRMVHKMTDMIKSRKLIGRITEEMSDLIESAILDMIDGATR